MNGSSSNAIEEDAWEWASAFGEDRYGLFADFEYKGAMQRFRWIEAGSFMMGSPASEVGHYGPEGPQHLVHHTVGFWLADTPCTQAMWEAVMGENPSHFRGVAERPVERVSFED